MANNIDNKIYEDKALLDKHLANYLKGLNKTIVLTEFILFVGSLLAALIVWNGIYPQPMKLYGFEVPLKVYVLEQFIHKVISWLIILGYFLMCRKADVEKRKNLFCSLSVTLTSFLAFGSWNVSYLGFLFITPVIISSPFAKNTQKRMFIICLILTIVYTIVQVYVKQDKRNYLIGILSIASVIIFYMISCNLHKTMFNALIDVREYSNINKKLYEEVQHDRLTNALSVSALHEAVDTEEVNNFKSLAFLDVDDFKSINDKYGHDMGDNVLKLLVNVCQMNNEVIYRYGGDEFVITSQKSAKDLCKDLECIKNQYTDAAKDKYNVRSTLSIGVINIVSKEKLFDYLKQCDKLMYISKAKGKNNITTED